MSSELDTLIALCSLAAICVGVGLQFGLALALIIGGTLTLAAVVAVKRGSP